MSASYKKIRSNAVHNYAQLLIERHKTQIEILEGVKAGDVVVTSVKTGK